jgi:molybdate transport repressor ModE-like protein
MTAALLIATGRTASKERFEPEKEIGTITAVERVALIFQQAGIQRIAVVCGDDGDRTEKLVSRMNLVFLRSPSTAEMLDSVKTGLAYLQDECTSVLITHVDVPLFSVNTVHALMAAEGPVCVPSYQGRRGHPMLLRAELYQRILSYAGENGLSGAVKELGVQKVIAVEDEGVLANIQGGASYDHLVARHDLSEVHPVFRLQLMKEKVFYGPGAQQLLQLVVETGSLLDACRHMGISYTKGRKIISNMEQQLGYPIIESQQGGKTGGVSFVTEAGRKLMHRYTLFHTEANQCLSALFEKHFPPEQEKQPTNQIEGTSA